MRRSRPEGMPQERTCCAMNDLPFGRENDLQRPTVVQKTRLFAKLFNDQRQPTMRIYCD